MWTDSQKWSIIVAGLLVVGGLYLLAPILTPFLIAGLLAYISDPLVDQLEAWRLTRTQAVVVVFCLILLGFGVVLLLLLPLLETQIQVFARALPTYIDWVTGTFLPWLEARLGVKTSLLDVEQLKTVLISHWQQAGEIVTSVVAYVTRSGAFLAGWLVDLVLIPIVTFYVLRDWDKLIASLHDLLPRALEPMVVELAREADAVLKAFLHGQLLMVLSLGAIYVIGLWLAGLEFALLIGVLAGCMSVVPYLGLIVGVVAASVAMLVQTQDITRLLPVLAVFGVGQVLADTVLTPLLVGERIGLHPVTVIFAILAGGQLFGFLGILLALPVTAVLAVLVRRARQSYKLSELYRTSETQGGASHAERP
jgi:predicted PurR-regulated permease PerM